MIDDDRIESVVTDDMEGVNLWICEFVNLTFVDYKEGVGGLFVDVCVFLILLCYVHYVS